MLFEELFNRLNRYGIENTNCYCKLLLISPLGLITDCRATSWLAIEQYTD